MEKEIAEDVLDLDKVVQKKPLNLFGEIFFYLVSSFRWHYFNWNIHFFFLNSF